MIVLDLIGGDARRRDRIYVAAQEVLQGLFIKKVTLLPKHDAWLMCHSFRLEMWQRGSMNCGWGVAGVLKNR